jgi:methylenetetrahydrofolate--tRNA-(uracil-5-)-methyltransferase
MERVTIIGAGLAGAEAAWQLAERGAEVELYEMRPERQTGAHRTGDCAELVCSNSFGTRQEDRAPGQLKWEMERLGSLVMKIAEATAVPAGGALAVDREAFARAVTEALEAHPRIALRRREITELPAGGPVVVASGPLTSPALGASLAGLTGEGHLYFYDAIAPLVRAESVDLKTAFRASRYGSGTQEDGDYLNCPMNREEYDRFVDALLAAERAPLKDFEKESEMYFEGCLPVEVLASRGREALAYGPLRPTGLDDPRTGRRPYANVQLRQDNVAATLYNLVGFQTNLKWGEQEKVLRLIPGLEQAEFERLGQMHRNTFINSPTLLTAGLQLKKDPRIFLAGQIVGAEGYMGNAATGALAGINCLKWLQGQAPLILPRETMLGALCHYITHAEPGHFQPMKANFGIMPPLGEAHVKNKGLRYKAYVERARASWPPELG